MTASECTRKLERRLADAHGTADARLLANATTGLCLALRAAGLVDQPVGIPNGVCMNVPLAVLLSGNVPVYLDIEPHHLGISMAAVETMERPLAAVIAVHAYGCIGDIEPLAAWCRARSVLLIEDLAAAQGARRDSRPAGAWGNVSVMSFGRGKIIDAGGGGAVLANDPSLLREIVRLESELPFAGSSDLEGADALNRRHTALYNATAGHVLPSQAAAFRREALAAAPGLVHRSRNEFAEQVLADLDGLAGNLERRARRARDLSERLGRDGGARFTVWEPPAGSVYWRVNVFDGSSRDAMFRHLLDSKFKVSSWYPPVDRFLEDRRTSGVATPVSDRVGDEILNLWVNDEVDERYVNAVVEAMVTFMPMPVS